MGGRALPLPLMPLLSLLLPLALLLLPRAAADVERDARLRVPELVRAHGYPLEEHVVPTADGYVLTAHRIPHARGARPGARGARTPVLVMHGLMCSSADFLVLGPGRALGYVLADAGYDVWLANARGSYYSRRHRTLDPDDREGQHFWKFSWDEIGNLDLPALADHVSAVTGRRRMHYVGYSQGTTAFMVLAALRPNFHARFLSFQALAPAVFSEYTLGTPRDRMVDFESVMHTLAFELGLSEMMPRSELVTELGLRWCRDGSALQPLCSQLVFGGDGASFNRTLLPVILGHNPAGASVRQVVHYSQVQRFQRFARFNFDPLTNMARYGRLRPPEYDVANVRVPTVLHYGLGDQNSLPQNVELLARRMGAVAALRRVPRPSFNHFDFLWGSDVREQLYDGMVDSMRAHDEL